MYGLPVHEYQRADRDGEKGGRGGGGNPTETHQISRTLRKELLHCVGGYTLDSLISQVKSKSKIYNSKHIIQILAKPPIVTI